MRFWWSFGLDKLHAIRHSKEGEVAWGGGSIDLLPDGRSELRVGRKRNSITLEANVQHLLTDVWTSVGVVAGVGAVALTGWQRLDPIVALGVAANIIWTGVRIVRRSTAGLMDSALPAEDQAAVQRILQTHQEAGVQFHKLQTRHAGARKFVSVHVRVPAGWTVDRGHALAGHIASDIRRAIPEAHVTTHLEPLDAPGSPTR